jgi:FG-GAP-like repeat
MSFSKLSKFKVFIIAIAVLLFGVSLFSSKLTKTNAASAGPSASHTNAPGEDNCTSCHTSFAVNSGLGTLSISGLPINYRPGQAYPVSVTQSDSNGVTYGFQTTSLDNLGKQAGTYTVAGSLIQTKTGIVGGNTRTYVEHTVDGIIPVVFGSRSWNFTWNAPATRKGKVSFYVAGNAANSDGSPGGDRIYTINAPTYSGSAISTFDGDGKADISVFRATNNTWYSLNSTNGNFVQTQFGASGDIITPGDYDGDGKTDQAVFRSSNGTWYLNRSTLGFTAIQFGAFGDKPAVGDYDGDGKYDLALFRASTGVWYIYHIGNGTFRIQQFGISTDVIGQGDYDADGKTDIAVYRNGTWFIWQSTTLSLAVQQFGIAGDSPMQGDYDGDGKTDTAVFRSSTGIWYLNRSTDGFTAAQFGISTDTPAPADYDGDGKTDIAIFRNGLWYILNSSNGTFLVIGFGIMNDRPIPSGYVN